MVPWAQALFLSLIIIIGLSAAGWWSALVVMLLIFGPVMGPMIFLGFYARRWQWSSVEVFEDDVLVRNPTQAHLFQLNTLKVSETGIDAGLWPFRYRITDPHGRSVLCFGLGRWGLLGHGALRAEDFVEATRLRQQPAS